MKTEPYDTQVGVSRRIRLSSIYKMTGTYDPQRPAPASRLYLAV